VVWSWGGGAGQETPGSRTRRASTCLSPWSPLPWQQPPLCHCHLYHMSYTSPWASLFLSFLHHPTLSASRSEPSMVYLFCTPHQPSSVPHMVRGTQPGLMKASVCLAHLRCPAPLQKPSRSQTLPLYTSRTAGSLIPASSTSTRHQNWGPGKHRWAESGA
jgi:hypothetical protein